MKEKRIPTKKKWNKPRVTAVPFKNTLSGGFVSTFEDITYSLPS